MAAEMGEREKLAKVLWRTLFAPNECEETVARVWADGSWPEDRRRVWKQADALLADGHARPPVEPSPASVEGLRRAFDDIDVQTLISDRVRADMHFDLYGLDAAADDIRAAFLAAALSVSRETSDV